MRKALLSIFVLVVTSFGCDEPSGESVSRPLSSEVEDDALRLHREVPLVDGHNDIPGRYREQVNRRVSELDIREHQPSLMTDIPRLRAGGVGAQFWSVYVPANLGESITQQIGRTSLKVEEAQSVRATMEQIDVVYRMLEQYPDTFELALTADDVERIFKSGKIASLIGMEGGHSIDSSLGVLRMFYKLGARYMTITHSRNTPWADSSTDEPVLGGLSEFGSDVIAEMNRVGMLVDLSHVSPSTMHDTLDVTEAPVIFSHSSAKALCDHPRNVPDDVLQRLPSNGGIVMVTFVPQFISQEVRDYGLARSSEENRLKALSGATEDSVLKGMELWQNSHAEPRATLLQVADHIDHIREVAGIDHIGIGSDFDGITSVPVGLEDVSKFVELTRELQSRGYKDEELYKVLGLNVLRVMRDAEKMSVSIASQRSPSEAIFPGRVGWN